jgi:hypothetical protein
MAKSSIKEVKRDIIFHKIYDKSFYSENDIITSTDVPNWFSCDAIKDYKKKKQKEYDAFVGELSRRSATYNT